MNDTRGKYYIFKATDEDAECYTRGKWCVTRLGIAEDHLEFSHWAEAVEHVKWLIWFNKVKLAAKLNIPAPRGDWNAYP